MAQANPPRRARTVREAVVACRTPWSAGAAPARRSPPRQGPCIRNLGLPQQPTPLVDELLALQQLHEDTGVVECASLISTVSIFFSTFASWDMESFAARHFIPRVALSGDAPWSTTVALRCSRPGP